MDNQELITELEFLYRKLISSGSYDRAQGVLLKLSELKTQNESGVTVDGKNILLG
jgi:hypothetical protein